MVKCKISEIITSKGATKPVIVDFQNGKIKEDEHNLKSKLYRSKNNRTVVGLKSNKIIYTGATNNDTLYNNFVMVVNKKTNNARLIQVDHATLYPLLKKDTNIFNVSVAPNNESMAELNKQFGSKRIKRKTEQHERLKMNIDVVKEQLEKTVADINIDETDFIGTKSNENDSLYRPHINRNASTKEQVYELEKLVPLNVLESLEDEAKTVLNTSDLTEYKMYPFIKCHISDLQNSETASTVLKCEILLYCNYLITFLMTPVKNMTKKFVLCQTSAEVNQHILDNFSINTSSGRTRPLSMKDKALCYILVLVMIALDYEVNIEKLGKDLKVGTERITDISRVLAFSTTSQKNVLTLKLPLPQAVSLSKRKKK